MSERCPECSGPLQLHNYLDSDDNTTHNTYVSKRDNGAGNKKGCGYSRSLKKEEWE